MRRSILFVTVFAALGSGCAKAGNHVVDYPDADLTVADQAVATATPQGSVGGIAAGFGGEDDGYRTDGAETKAAELELSGDEDAPMLMSRNVAEEAAPADEARGGLFSRVRDRRAARKAKREPARTEVAAAAPATTLDPSAAPAPAIADDKPTPQDHGRQIVYTAAMHVTVFNMDEAMQAATEIPEQHGGYVHSLTEGRIVMRIPAKHLRAVMDALGGYGVIESRSLTAQDMTAEYTDLESRIRVLRETQNQLIELLGKARTVEEALRVRETLDGITMELELALGRMRQLENLVSFSTLTLTMVERGPNQPLPSSNDPFPWVDGLGVEATQWK